MFIAIHTAACRGGGFLAHGVLNKIDPISADEEAAITGFIKEIYPAAPVMTMSALEGT